MRNVSTFLLTILVAAAYCAGIDTLSDNAFKISIPDTSEIVKGTTMEQDSTANVKTDTDSIMVKNQERQAEKGEEKKLTYLGTDSLPKLVKQINPSDIEKVLETEQRNSINNKTNTDSMQVTNQKSGKTRDISKFVKKGRRNLIHLTLNGVVGMSNSYIKSRGLLKYYFEPVSKSINRSAPEFEITMDFYIGNYFSLNTGFTYFQFGQRTKEENVYFNDNIFKHTLKTVSETNYVGVPLLLKCGFQKQHVSTFLNCGFIPVCLESDNVKWVIDGRNVEENTRLPAVKIKGWDVLFTTGIETGYWFKNNGLMVVGRYLWGCKSISSDIEGSAFNRAYSIGLKYSRKIF